MQLKKFLHFRLYGGGHERGPNHMVFNTGSPLGWDTVVRDTNIIEYDTILSSPNITRTPHTRSFIFHLPLRLFARRERCVGLGSCPSDAEPRPHGGVHERGPNHMVLSTGSTQVPRFSTRVTQLLHINRIVYDTILVSPIITRTPHKSLFVLYLPLRLFAPRWRCVRLGSCPSDDGISPAEVDINVEQFKWCFSRDLQMQHDSTQVGHGCPRHQQNRK